MQIHQGFVKWRLSSVTWWISNFSEYKTNPESLEKCRFPGHRSKIVTRLVWKGQCFEKAKCPAGKEAASDHTTVSQMLTLGHLFHGMLCKN